MFRIVTCQLNVPVVVLLCCHFSSTTAAPPSAAARLPEYTVALVRIPDAEQFASRIKDSALGQLLEDEQVRPLYEKLYGSVTPSIEQFESQIGVKLEDLLSIPDGQVAVAMVAMPAFPPVPVLIVDLTDQDQQEQLGQDLQGALTTGGFGQAQEEISGTTCQVYTRAAEDLNELVQFQLGDSFVVAASRRVAERMIEISKGGDYESLADSTDYQSLRSRCQIGDTAAQIEWYVNPISLVRSLTRDNPGATTVIAMLPAIGVDGLLAVGGSIQLAEGEFDSIVHTHVLLDQPRNGVLQMLTFSSGSNQPETWVPADVVNYSTWHLDPKRTLTVLEEVVNSFRGEGALQQFLERRITEQTGLDLYNKLIPAMAGRITTFTWFEQPVTLTSQSTLVGIELEDVAVVKEAMQQLTERFSDRLEASPFGNTTIYSVKSNQPEEVSSEPTDENGEQIQRRRRGRRGRRPTPSMAIVSNYLLVADRPTILETAVLAESNSVPRLRDELDFKLMLSKAMQQIGSTTVPSMVAFERPSESLKVAYQLLQSEEVRRMVSENRERNEFLAAVDDALQNDELPPFEVLARYLSPRVAVLSDEQIGLHHVGFSMRRRANDE